jgi:F-type H+-transporting ATPase subunit b
MISINATLLAQVIHFLILMFILNRLMFQPLLKLIRERKEYTEETSNRIKSLEKDTERLRQEFIFKENDARKNATAERAEYRGVGIIEGSELIEESRKEVAAIKTKADREIEAEFNKTQSLLHDEAEALAGDITEMVVGRRISA